MTVLGALAVATAVQIVVALAAYHRGRRHGRIRLPGDLVQELREHKLCCIGEPAERVDLEIALLCEVDGGPSRIACITSPRISR